MSHYTELKPKFLTKSEPELIASLQKLFGEKSVEVHEKAVNIGGYDSQAGKKAHIVVRKDTVRKVCGTHGWNDIGYERDNDGMYKLWADPTDYPVEKQNIVAQDYAERVAAKKLKAQGYTLKREVLKDGVVKLVATKYG